MTPQAATSCAVVTGGTRGIGAAIAEGLAAAGLRVIVVGRSLASGQAVAERLRQVYGADARFEQADLSAGRGVAQLVQRIGSAQPSIDVLVNCAAGVFEQRRASVDGIEYTLALNHLGPLSLTLGLEPLLRRARQARVVNVAADPRMLAAQPPDPDDLEMQCGYSGVKAYMRGKNLNVITTYELARRWADSRITFNAYHPGIVRTGLADHLGAGKRLAVWLATPLLLSPEQGADTGVWLATSNAMGGVSGRFFVKRREVPSAPCTYDTALAVLVWIRSMALLQREAAAA